MSEENKLSSLNKYYYSKIQAKSHSKMWFSERRVEGKQFTESIPFNSDELPTYEDSVFLGVYLESEEHSYSIPALLDSYMGLMGAVK